MVRVDLPAQRRKESESQRELQLICMSNLLSATAARVYFKDLQNRFLLVSAGWIAAYAPDRTAKDMVGKTDFDVFSAEHASAASRDEQRVISTGESIVGKVELETYGGRTDTWVSTTKMPLRDSRERIIGTFGISRDVTAQRRAENTLAEQALQLIAQNERLRELDRLKDEFIGMFSHELRTPLASILGYVEILMEDGLSGPEADHCVEVIDRNAKRLLRLAGDLQLLAQINSGQMPMDFRGADLADIAACAVEEMRPEADRKHIDLVLSATGVSRLAVDPTRMAQLLGNLLSNAVKFTPDGGKVEVGLRTEGDQAVLTVADTGIGIPVADRERIFERFFRTATAKRQAIQGTGLGLTITQAIVAAHHGTIAVEGDEGHGSTFTVRLPLWPTPAPGTAARAAAATTVTAEPAGARNVPLRPRHRGRHGPGLESGAGAEHRFDQGSPLDFGGVLLAEHAELEHGRGDALDARLVHRADRITGQHHGRGHLARQVVVPRHRGLDGRAVAVGDSLSLFDGSHERGRRLGVLLRPGLGRHVPVDGEVRGVALVEVSQHLIAVLLLRHGDVGLGEKRRGPGAVLKVPGHRGEAIVVRDELHLLRRDSVFGQQRADQQGADAVGSVDPDLLARQLGDCRNRRVSGGDQRAGARPQDGGLGQDAEPGPRRLR